MDKQEVRVTLSAVVDHNQMVILLDCYGEPIVIITADRLGNFAYRKAWAKKFNIDPKWAKCVMKMLKIMRQKQKEAENASNEWGKWCDSIDSSCRMRRKMMRYYKPQQQRKHPLPATWERSVKTMNTKLYSALRFTGKSPWSAWANTTCKNHYKRKAIKDGEQNCRQSVDAAASID